VIEQRNERLDKLAWIDRVRRFYPAGILSRLWRDEGLTAFRRTAKLDNFLLMFFYFKLVVGTPGNSQNDVANSFLYIDGNLKSVDATVVTDPVLTWSGGIKISGSTGCDIPTFRTYPFVLTSAQVQCNYNAGSTR